MEHDSAIDILFRYTLAGDMLETLNRSISPGLPARGEVADTTVSHPIHMGVEVADWKRLAN